MELPLCPLNWHNKGQPLPNWQLIPQISIENVAGGGQFLRHIFGKRVVDVRRENAVHYTGQHDEEGHAEWTAPLKADHVNGQQDSAHQQLTEQRSAYNISQ